MPLLSNNLKEKKSILYTKPVFVIFLVFCIILSLNVIDIVKKYKNAYKEEKIAQEEFKKLQERRIILEKDIKKIGTDEGVEDLVRRQYPIAKPGEGVIMIIDNPKTILPEENITIFSKFSSLFKNE